MVIHAPHVGFSLSWWGSQIFLQPQNQKGVEGRQTHYHPSTLFSPPPTDLWGPHCSCTHANLVGSWVCDTPQCLHTSTHEWGSHPCLLPWGSPVPQTRAHPSGGISIGWQNQTITRLR